MKTVSIIIKREIRDFTAPEEAIVQIAFNYNFILDRIEVLLLSHILFTHKSTII